jgi:predicted Zn-dependent protease
MNKAQLIIAVLVAAFSLFSYFGSSSVNQITGEKQHIAISPSQEIALGLQAAPEMIQEYGGEEKATEAAERVRTIGNLVVKQSDAKSTPYQFQFHLLGDRKTVNAFALPGGKVGVYSGLIKLVASDDEIAIVMGHEIAHVTARHGAQRMTNGVVAAGLGVLLGVATNDSRNSDAILAGYGLFAGGTVLAFSRAHESEADHIGLHYAAKAGYDPHASIAFWEKMAKANEGSNVPVFLRTHPSDERRIADLQKWIPETIPLYEAAKQKYQ